MTNILRKTISDTKGMTLTELLVASILVGIVMMGTVSFGVAVKQMQGSTSKSVILAMKVKAVMAMMAKDASQSVGDYNDLGIRTKTTGAGGINKRSICFRHDTNDPSTYNDDTWVCYYRDTTNVLWHCFEPTPIDNVPPNNATQCENGGTKDRLLELDPGNNAFFDRVMDVNDRLDHIELNLASLYDQSQPMHVINNPSYQINTRISPAGHGR